MNLSDICSFSTTNGMAVPDYAEVYAAVKEETCEAFGVSPNSGDFPETPLGRFIEMIASVVFSALSVAAQNANAMMPEYAAGRWLDNVAKLFGIERRGATHSRVQATLSGVAYTTIPAGSMASTGAGDVFALESDVQIGSAGDVVGWFVAMEEGAVPCDALALTTVLSAVVGWTSVSNPTACRIGQEVESDANLRTRISRTRASGTGSTGAVEHAISGIDSTKIRSCLVLENGDSNSQTVDGVTLAGHTIHVCVDFDETDELKQSIAEAIFNTKTCGCGYSVSGGAGNEFTIPVTSGGVVYNVNFCKPSAVSTSVSCTMTSGSYSGGDLRAAVVAAITSYMNSGLIGHDLSVYELSSIISGAAPGCVISDLHFNASGTTVTIRGNKVSSLGALTLTIDGRAS